LKLLDIVADRFREINWLGDFLSWFHFIIKRKYVKIIVD
jgi:hypothetical protein